MNRASVSIVDACLREEKGGSPTAVLDDLPLSESSRRQVPIQAGTSHAVFISHGLHAVSLRFWTATGELPACGHGTVAALAVLAERSGQVEYRSDVHLAGQVVQGRAAHSRGRTEAAFTTASVALREPTAQETAHIHAALGLEHGGLAPGACVATLGRARMLVPVSSRGELMALAPEPDQLARVCDRLDVLGCYVHTVPDDSGRAAARMFAPAIGVAEDVANANSTACLATRVASRGTTRIVVDMGDSLGRPSTIVAGVRSTPTGSVTYVGGTARVAGRLDLPIIPDGGGPTRH